MLFHCQKLKYLSFARSQVSLASGSILNTFKYIRLAPLIPESTYLAVKLIKPSLKYTYDEHDCSVTTKLLKSWANFEEEPSRLC